MSYIGEEDLGSSFGPFVAFRKQLGFVPNLYRALTLRPTTIEAGAALIDSILFKERALTQVQKECVLFVLSAARCNPYCFALHYQMLKVLGVPEQRLDQIAADYQRVDLSPVNKALLNFALKLGLNGPSVCRDDVRCALSSGLTDESLLEATLSTGLSAFLCTLATGLGSAPDFPSKPIHPMPGMITIFDGPPAEHDGLGPYFRIPELQGQDLWPDVLEAQAGLIRTVLLAEGSLTRVQKEAVALAVSAANQSTYWVTLHGESLRKLGISPEKADQIAIDHRASDLAEPDIAALNFAVKLSAQDSGFGSTEIDSLRRQGFTDEQALEVVVLTALTNFLNTLQFGLGTTPDFSLPRAAPARLSKKAHLPVEKPRLSGEGLYTDPDADTVERVQGGDINAFEELINRHSRRVYRTLVGILGDSEEARDAMQDTFLKAFQHITSFERRSKFSTWLVSIASNTGIQRLRERRQPESLDDSGFESEEGFRPRQIQAWADDPEKLYSQMEMHSLVENGVMKLPAKYRVVIMLRDIEQLSTEEAAAALGLGISALKARLLRGRLMLREALSPHFSKGAKGVAS